MDWLTHNPITDIHGPAFLVVYGAIAAVVMVAARQLILSRDDTGRREPPPVPPELDPYEIAYLRGGRHAVIRTAVYALCQLGAVTVIAKTWRTVARFAATDAPPTRPLNPIERRVLDQLRSPVTPSSLFRAPLTDTVEGLCAPFRSRLESQQLLRSEEARSATTWIAVAAAGLLAALSLYKVLAAAGRPVGFLIGLTVVALFILWATVGAAARAPISARGKVWLKRVQDAYRGDAARPADATASDAVPVALVGLFGIGILTGTPDAAVANLFSAAGRSGCGGGCGSGGGGDGGGCGGGCGG